MGVGRTRLKHIFFNPNWKRKKSNKKHKKLVEQYIRLLKRETKDGMTKWIAKAKVKCVLRIKKYGITVDQINAVLERKGLKDLFVKTIV